MVESLEYYRGKYDASHNLNRNNIDRVLSGLPTDTSVEGRFMVDGSGEALRTVSFPVIFIQIPNMTYGGELNLDSHAVAGSFPIMSAVVNKWETNPPIEISITTDYSKVYFIGAELAIVTTGPVGQRMWIHWRASGRAIVGPSGTTI